ncbi:MAG: adenylate/guanylate cyclase domain-containing response regulator [Gammaproteobacteria bacterium]|nr:MAG: adenylate/guanylate cyclase domain-containing response regulator [Gammaproteobacteria bacterium]RKZ74469.1 MAG: adenylate/guanylate cyclase domain-containing response regulator [Gammaproteobacteria bacterium]
MNLTTSDKDTILVVDDIPENVGVLYTVLNQHFKVLIAKSGKQALKTIEMVLVDLIVLDVMMPPGMSGFEVCKILKSQKETQDIPIIFMTALADTVNKLKGFELGAADYVTKPIQQDEILARINAHLKIRKLQLQLQAKNKQLQQQADELAKRNNIIIQEKQKSDKLLLNILPIRVANDLKETGKTEPEAFDNVTVFFSDIIDFTKISSQLETPVLISELNSIFTTFDNIIELHQCERIKTIGDAYLAVCGMPEKNSNHAENIINAAIDILEYLTKRNQNMTQEKWKVRIGIHTGKVIGGVVGIKKYIYDVFGDTINTASRMESNSEQMKINISDTTYRIVKDKFKVTPRVPLSVKGKGKMNMYFIDNS